VTLNGRLDAETRDLGECQRLKKPAVDLPAVILLHLLVNDTDSAYDCARALWMPHFDIEQAAQFHGLGCGECHAADTEIVHRPPQQGCPERPLTIGDDSGPRECRQDGNEATSGSARIAPSLARGRTACSGGAERGRAEDRSVSVAADGPDDC
jgi:hypothetical protein